MTLMKCKGGIQMKKVFMIMIIIAVYLMPSNIYASNYNSTINDNLIDDQVESNIVESQENQYGVLDFLNQSKQYTNDIDIKDIFKSALSGNFKNEKIIKYTIQLFNENIKSAICMIIGIIIIIIINSILKAISENLGNDQVSKIASYLQYILIVTLVMKNFSDTLMSIKNTISKLHTFTMSLIPLLTSIMAATGSVTSSNMIEPILLIIVTFISNFVVNILLPIILVATTLGIISKISDQIQVDKLAKFLKSSSIWITTTMLTLFVTIASVESGLTSSLDGVTTKTGKALVATAIPLVGKILGDAFDTVMGYANIIKNGIGVVGIVVIICICLKPIIEIASLTIIYYFGAAICQPIADKNIVELLEQMGGTFKLFLALMFTIMTVLIVGIAIVMKVSNNTVMYG